MTGVPSDFDGESVIQRAVQITDGLVVKHVQFSYSCIEEIRCALSHTAPGFIQ